MTIKEPNRHVAEPANYPIAGAAKLPLISSTWRWNSSSESTGWSCPRLTVGMMSTQDVHPRYSGMNGTTTGFSIW